MPDGWMESLGGWLTQPWAQALVVVAAALVAGKIFQVVICGFLTRLTARTRGDLDDKLLAHLRGPLFLTILLLGFDMALGILAPPEPFAWLLGALVRTLGVLIWGMALTRLLHVLLEVIALGAARVTWMDSRTIPLVENVGRIVIVGGAIYALLVTWDLDVRPWLASAGIAGVAIGFAAKDSLANLFGGLFIIADAPYKLGDFIILDSGERGRVTRIGLRSTRILTRDDVEITLPNAQIANAKIVNESGGPHEKERVSVRVGVAYGSDIDRVRAVLLEAAATVELVAEDPPPQVRFDAFGESSLDFRVLAYVDEPVLRGRLMDALNTAVYKGLMASGITIPFPQRDLWVKELPTRDQGRP